MMTRSSEEANREMKMEVEDVHDHDHDHLVLEDNADVDDHSHLVLEDIAGVDNLDHEKALDLEEVYKNITRGHPDQYAIAMINTSTSSTELERSPLCEVDVNEKADEFIKKFRENLNMERQKSADEFWAVLDRSA